MTSKRYIDANALTEYIDRTIPREVGEEFWKGAITVRHVIQIQPTADVVEVVRCKDCENYRLDRPVSSDDRSHHFCCVHNRYLFVEDYCGYGVRKDDCEND